MEGLGINIWEIALHVINIVILFVVLRFLLYKPITKFMKKRSDGIANQLNEAAAKQSEAEKLHAQYEEMMKNAQSLAGELIEKSKTAADNQANVIVEDARRQAKEIFDRSKTDVETVKLQARSEMREQIVAMAVEIAEKVLKREVSLKDNMQIIDSFFNEGVTEQ